ncbi:MAG TPA: hypothetical protein VFS83_18500 [Ktedonobacterales bacterium]|nr:hypothetical protein [Ktedonobacterales bacterium]
MAHQYLNDGEEEEARARPVNEPERHEGSHEDISAEEASGGVDEPVGAHAAKRPRRDKSESDDTPERQADAKPEDVVDDAEPEEDDLRKLEAQGFTEDEVNRLVELSERINARTLKRLQFTKWLVDQGLLDEFSVRTE